MGKSDWETVVREDNGFINVQAKVVKKRDVARIKTNNSLILYLLNIIYPLNAKELHLSL